MNILWCIGYISGQTCYLNMTQEEAELRWRAENDGEIETIQKVCRRRRARPTPSRC